MKNPFRRKHKHTANTIHLVPTDNFHECAKLGHIVTTFQYGSHPQRVMAFCPYHEPDPLVAFLDWKDTKGRLFNRLQFSVSYLYGSIIAFGGIALIVYVIYVALTSHL